MPERLTTKEAADLLKVSKRTIIRYAEKYNWTKYPTTDGQGRTVTMYDRADIVALRPDAAVTETDPLVTETKTETPVTEAPDLAPVTMTPDNAATIALQDAVAMIAASQRQTANKITAAIAAAAVALMVGIGASGYALMSRHDAELAADRIEREKAHQIQIAAIAERAKAQKEEMERIEARRAIEAARVQKALEAQQKAHREEIRAMQGRMEDQAQFNRFLWETRGE